MVQPRQFDTTIDECTSLKIHFGIHQISKERVLDDAKPVVVILDQFFNQINELDGSKVIIYGSWVRGTSVYTISDLNIAYELPQKIIERVINLQFGGPIGLLNLIYNLLTKNFPFVSANFNEGSISVKLSSNLTVSLRPCLRYPQVGLTYANGSRGGVWRSFNPQLCIDAFQKLDPVIRENLIAICRATRLWKKNFSVPITGVLIDVLAYNFIHLSPYRNKSVKYNDCMLRDFFQFLGNVDREQDTWRAPLSSETIIRTGYFENLAQDAYLLAQQAIDCYSARQERDSIKLWRRVLGPEYIEA